MKIIDIIKRIISPNPKVVSHEVMHYIMCKRYNVPVYKIENNHCVIDVNKINSIDVMDKVKICMSPIIVEDCDINDDPMICDRRVIKDVPDDVVRSVVPDIKDYINIPDVKNEYNRVYNIVMKKGDYIPDRDD